MIDAGWNATDPAQMAALPKADLPAATARYAGAFRLDSASAGYVLTNQPDGYIRKQVLLPA